MRKIFQNVPASVTQSAARPTGDQEVAGSIPARSGNMLSWRLIMKYFLWSFSLFRWFKKGICQFLAKECAQILVNHLEDLRDSLEKVWLGKLTVLNITLMGWLGHKTPTQTNKMSSAGIFTQHANP